MKYIAIILVLMALAMFGCSGQDTIPEQNESVEQPQGQNLQVMDICNSLCNVDALEYCETERTIIVNGVEVTGTCRAFSQNEDVPGFERCFEFCNEFDRSGTDCRVNGQVDTNCDGII